MMINAFGFLVGRAIAQRQGVSDAEASRLGLVGAIVRPPALGIVLVASVARNEAKPAAQALPAPLVVNAVALSTSQVILTWNAVPGAASYDVVRSGTKDPVATTTTTGYDDEDVDSGTTYTYRVDALNSKGDTIRSSTLVSVTTLSSASAKGASK